MHHSKGITLGSRQERFLRTLSTRYQSLTDTMRIAKLSPTHDSYVIRSLKKKGFVLVSDHNRGDRVVRITAEGARRLNSAVDMITSQEVTDEMPRYFGFRQRQALRMFRRTPAIKPRDIARRLGIDRRFAERIMVKLYRFQFVTDIGGGQFVLMERGMKWLDDDCKMRGIKRYPSVEE